MALKVMDISADSKGHFLMNCMKAPWNCASPHLDTTTRALLMEAEASDTRTLVDYREVEDARSSVELGERPFVLYPKSCKNSWIRGA